ncbi:outer membrane beta-barrel protein [Marinilabilia sp.]|uniref:type IX secretion/gliding motility protein PorT/SprT n=1 Tax=Marinilabilia sp. TaxID=2021252 RepID=UPI0025B9F2A2|nr:outer membrane beta-barrel protein [Marinilabilia sp.]
MRLFVLFVCLLVFQAPSFSQMEKKKKVPNLPAFDYKPLHFGFLIGLNSMDFKVRHKLPADRPDGLENRYAEVVSLNPGVNIGIVSSLRLNKNLNLRFLPGISFGQRDLLYIQDGEQDQAPLEIKSTFLEFPLLIKFSGDRMTNFKPYLIGGINPRIDLAKTENDGLSLKSNDLYLELGTGVDMYLNYFRLSTEIKISVGLRNVLNPGGTGEPEDVFYTDVLDRLSSRLFVFSFYFE